jgi:hypothetical protein
MNTSPFIPCSVGTRSADTAIAMVRGIRAGATLRRQQALRDRSEGVHGSCTRGFDLVCQGATP